MHLRNRNNHDADNTCSKTAGGIPDAPETARILHERAVRYAAHITEETNSTSLLVRYIRFRLGAEEFYGIPYPYTEEVMRNVRLTPMPSVPAFIKGIINRRGALIAVLDIKAFFPVEPASYDENACIIIVKNQKITMGILADGVYESDAYAEKNLEPALPSEAAKRPDYILGLHAGKTAILNIEKILSDPSIQLEKNGKGIGI